MQANAKPAKQAPANAAKAKASKKGKGGPSFGLGKGTTLVRAFVNDAIAHAISQPNAPEKTDRQDQGVQLMLQSLLPLHTVDWCAPTHCGHEDVCALCA